MFETDSPDKQTNAPSPPIRTVQWGSGGETRITENDREDISEAVDDTMPGTYRSLFPLHGAFGVISLGVDGHTLWLFQDGATYIAGELVDPSTARPKGLSSAGTVDISALGKAEQEAILTLLAAKRRR
jgi:hypothetical protein